MKSILNFSDKSFKLDGTLHSKRYELRKGLGNTLSLVSTTDRNDILFENEKATAISIDGENFETADDLMLAFEDLKPNFNTPGESGQSNSGVINVKDFGAVGDGVTDDTTAIQLAIDSELTDDIVLYFPKGNYRVDTQVTMWNKFRKILFKGDGSYIFPRMTDNLSTFKIGSSVAETSPIYPRNVLTFGVYFDYTNATPTVECAGISYNSILGTLNLIDVNHYNFKNNNTVGCEFLNIGNNPVLSKNNSHPGFNMTLCNFYNESLVEATSYDYLSNNTFGVAVKIGNTNIDASEYWQIDNCQFFGVYKGTWIKSGANGKISNSNFQYCNPIISGGSIEDGIVKIESSTDNDGKLSISHCDFNHNFGTAIYGVASALRPVIVDTCFFIANAYLPIKLTSVSGNSINNCTFDRANLYSSFVNPPTFTAIHYIILLAGNGTSVQNNTFFTGATRCVSSTGTDNVITGNKYASGLTLTNLTDGVGGNTVQSNYPKASL